VFSKAATIIVSLCFASLLYAGEKARPVKGSIQVLEQKYCHSDDDTFVVSLKLKLIVRNTSKRVVFLSSDMAPFVGRVARSLRSAKAGKFEYESAWAGATASQDSFKEVPIKPGRDGMLIIGYDLLARFKEEQDLPRTVAPGKYALQLVLHPKHQGDSANEIKTVVADPFVIDVPANVKPQHCKVEEN
jgi:hypothetical protein